MVTILIPIPDQSTYTPRSSSRTLTLLGPREDIERELGDGVFELVEVVAEAVPCVLHGVEELVLQSKIALSPFLQDPVEGAGIEVYGKGRDLEVPGVGLDDGATNCHALLWHGGRRGWRGEFNCF